MQCKLVFLSDIGQFLWSNDTKILEYFFKFRNTSICLRLTKISLKMKHTHIQKEKEKTWIKWTNKNLIQEAFERNIEITKTKH